MLLLITILLPLAIVMTIVAWTAINGIGPLPTTGKQKKAMFSALPESVGGTIYELGSGWGGLGVALAKRYPGCRVIGIENSPIPYWISRVVAKFSGCQNLEFRWQNIQEHRLSDASLIVSYLHTGAMKKLKPKLERELSGNTWIVSNTF